MAIFAKADQILRAGPVFAGNGDADFWYFPYYYTIFFARGLTL